MEIDKLKDMNYVSFYSPFYIKRHPLSVFKMNNANNNNNNNDDEILIDV